MMTSKLFEAIPPHPLKATFEKHGIRPGNIARALDYSFSHVCNVMSGRVDPGKRLENGLRELAQAVEAEAAAGKTDQP